MKACPLARPALHADASAMRCNDFMDDRQTQSGAFGFGGVVGVENVPLPSFRNAFAGIVDSEVYGTITGCPAADLHLPACRHGLDGIQIQVQQALGKTVGIDDGPTGGIDIDFLFDRDVLGHSIRRDQFKRMRQ